ncbi:adenylosuccinate lyase [Mycoplasmatota bacterium]|nr:adenylosuccinate lyase [Mycoplasmatota bacterium]
MINRYARDEMKNIWSDENKFKTWLKVELLACEAWSQLGHIPKEDVLVLWDKAKFEMKRISEIEQDTRHDVIAFTRAVSESLGNEKKWVHYGLTSTDVVDTAYGYQIKQANDILRKDLETFIKVLKEKAIQYKHTVQMGRTHGIHAELTTFGLKLALWYEEMNRNFTRFEQACSDIEVGKMSGAVGTFANIPPFVQQYVCEKLGIEASKISTQVLQRDRHAFYLNVLGLIASSLEKMAVEIRHLQRTEVKEVEEFFNKNQKGSSAMPHKRNPIGSENIVGCARVMHGYALTSYENVPLWHERDISHSSAERIIIPDATILLDYMLNRFTKIIKNLVVYEDKMLKNIELTNGVIFSQQVLLKLIEKGLTREEAYDLVQSKAMIAYHNNHAFLEILKEDNKITKLLTLDEIDDCFNTNYHLKAVDEIYTSLGLD